MKGGKSIAQFGDLQYEIGEISDNDEYRKVLHMLRMFKENSSFKKAYGEGVVMEPDKRPAPEGGMEAWNSFLAQNLKMPPQARELGVDDVVYAQFIVDKAGKISSPIILRALGMGLDDEVLRILTLSKAPKWTPAEKNGQPVSTVMIVPVKFQTDHVADVQAFFPVKPTPTPVSHNGEEVFDVVERMPEPSGGM